MMKEQEVLARIEGLTYSRLTICIEESWVSPARDEGGCLFDELDVARLQLISELIEDMAVNDEAIPIILSLVDQLHLLRRNLRGLEQAVSAQDETVKAAIAAHLEHDRKDRSI
ncbi:MAG: chaperone modulator CbpM [Rhodospirillales bacterium]